MFSNYNLYIFNHQNYLKYLTFRILHTQKLILLAKKLYWVEKKIQHEKCGKKPIAHFSPPIWKMQLIFLLPKWWLLLYILKILFYSKNQEVYSGVESKWFIVSQNLSLFQEFIVGCSYDYKIFWNKIYWFLKNLADIIYTH